MFGRSSYLSITRIRMHSGAFMGANVWGFVDTCQLKFSIRYLKNKITPNMFGIIFIGRVIGGIFLQA